MARSVLTITIDMDIPESTARTRYLARAADDRRTAISAAKNALDAVSSGILTGSVSIHLGDGTGTAAARNIACTQANAAGNWVQVSGVRLTEGVDFLRGASDATLATALRAAINAHRQLREMVTAAGATNNVTVTSKLVGAASETLSITTDDATAFAITSTATGTAGASTRGTRAFSFAKRAS